MKFIILLGLSILLNGCSTFDRISTVGTIIDSGERLVISNDGDTTRMICSEPPPDVSSSVFQAISASLSGSVEDRASGQAALSSITNEDVVQLFSRSQGIQGLRDGMYRTCEAYINGGISSETYGQQMTYMTATLNFLVTIELCGKILEAENLTAQEASQESDSARDLRPELYSGCLITAEQFAGAILGAGNNFQLTR